MSTPPRTRRAVNHRAPKAVNALPENSRTKIIARVVLLIALSLVSVWIGQDFLAPIGWAFVIAITTWPLYLKFSNLFGAHRESSLPPFLFTAIAGAMIFLPVALASHRASEDVQSLERTFVEYRQNGIPVPEWLQHVPAVGELGSRWWKANLSDPAAAAVWIGQSDRKEQAAMTRSVGAEVAHRMFLFLIALIALFSILRHGAWIANRFLDTADRLLGAPGERLASKLVDAIRGTVNGTVIVAVVEGALIGAAYFVAGVPHAFLFGLLTMAFAMLPFGAWAVFTSVSLLLVAQGGSVVAAAGIFGFGAIVMLIGDTFVWPALVGNAARLPFLLALIGIFGGLEAFGLIGLFLGPVILAALLMVWREWLVPAPARVDRPIDSKAS